MTIKMAEEIFNAFGYKPLLTEDEERRLIQALRFLVDKTGDTNWMVELGGYYYEQKQFDKALKYYEMADECGDAWAPEGLGYIWYYGRTGQKDYEKAFKYYSKAAKNGFLKSKIKVADMYKNGYYVEKDYGKYCEIIEDAFKDVEDAEYLNEPKPEVYTRLARIRKEQGRMYEAVDFYLEAKGFLAQRIRFNPFFGDLNSMKWLVEDLYSIIPLDYGKMDLFDLYEVLRKPAEASFMYVGNRYTVRSVQDGDGMRVLFGDQSFASVDDFFYKATISGERIVVMYDMFYGFEVK